MLNSPTHQHTTVATYFECDEIWIRCWCWVLQQKQPKQQQKTTPPPANPKRIKSKKDTQKYHEMQGHYFTHSLHITHYHSTHSIYSEECDWGCNGQSEGFWFRNCLLGRSFFLVVFLFCGILLEQKQTEEFKSAQRPPNHSFTINFIFSFMNLIK